MAIITAAGLCHIKNRKIKALILGAAALFAVFQFYVLSYAAWESRQSSIGGVRIFGEDGFGANYEMGCQPSNEMFKSEELFRIIGQHSRGQKSFVFFIPLMNPSYGQYELPFRMSLVGQSLKVVFFDGALYADGKAGDARGIIDSVNFLVCYGSTKFTEEWFLEATLPALLRSSSLWLNFEKVEKQQDPRRWEEFLAHINNDGNKFNLIAYETEESGNVIALYERVSAK
jgi:hypothetical protein